MYNNPYLSSQQGSNSNAYATQNAYNNEYAQAQAQQQAYEQWLAQKQAYDKWQEQNQAYEDWKIRQREDEIKKQRKKESLSVNAQNGPGNAPGYLTAFGISLNPETARQAIILSEIIGKPVSKRKTSYNNR